MTTENTRYDYDNPNSHFGGIIRLSDFDTCHSGSRDIANRIASDWRFNEQCRKNGEVRDKRIKENKEE